MSEIFLAISKRSFECDGPLLNRDCTKAQYRCLTCRPAFLSERGVTRLTVVSLANGTFYVCKRLCKQLIINENPLLILHCLHNMQNIQLILSLFELSAAFDFKMFSPGCGLNATKCHSPKSLFHLASSVADSALLLVLMPSQRCIIFPASEMFIPLNCSAFHQDVQFSSI